MNKDKLLYDVTAYFKTRRFSNSNHLGLGDIRLSIDEQSEILRLIEHAGTQIAPAKKENIYGHVLNAMSYAQNKSDWNACRRKAGIITKAIIRRCLNEYGHFLEIEEEG